MAAIDESSDVETIAEPEPEPSQAYLNAPPENRLAVTIDQQTWLDIRDVTGEKLVYRTVEAGEGLQLVGTPPFYVFIGTVEGVEIDYLGEPVEYEPDEGGVFARFRVGNIPE